MDGERFDFSVCGRAEKEIVEGLCLSFDILRGLCMETLQECEARQDRGGETGAER